MAATTHRTRRSTSLPGAAGLFSADASAGPAGMDGKLLRVVDGCLFSALFFAPYFMGGRHPMGRFVYTVLAVVAAVAWCARQVARGRGRFSSWSAGAIVSLALLIVVAQLVPLPAGLHASLGGETSAKLTLWDSIASPGHS